MTDASPPWVQTEVPRGPLAGRRIVVTRAQHQAHGLVSRLHEEQAVPLLAPAITIEVRTPAPQALRAHLEALTPTDWLVWTSRNGVEATWQLMDELGYVWPADGPRVAVVGPGTASAVEAKGGRVSFVSSEHRAEALAASIPDVAHRRVLWCHGQRADQRPLRLLHARQADAHGRVVYDTRSGADQADVQRVHAQHPDAYTFTSVSTVEGFMAGVAAAPSVPRAFWGTGHVVAIGPVTAAALREADVPVHAVAHPHSLEGMVEVLRTLFRPSV
ncbi:MAG: uroporphyrinogen-III synthase [Bacteroidota bacterium]